jgi:hypothetical protein
VLSASGCGYRFHPAGDKISRDIRKVYVDVFTNNTAEANIETTFRNAFIDQIIKGRRFVNVNAAGLADAVLKGDIKNLTASPLAYRGESNLALEKRITVTLSLTLDEKDTKKTLWREDNFSQWGDYTLDSQNLIASQKNALVKMANDAAERAYRMMVADF